MSKDNTPRGQESAEADSNVEPIDSVVNDLIRQYGDVPRTSWFRRKLDRVDIPSPEYLPRADGVNLLYSGKAHSFIGESETMKTWCAILACKDFMDRGQNVMYIDCEGSPGPFAEHMDQLGIGAAQRQRMICYIRPEEPLKFGEQTGAEFVQLGRLFDPRLIVIDGVTEFFALYGWDINSATDIARYQKLILRRFPGEATTLEIDHTGKDGTRGAVGSQHKRAGIDGATYLFKNKGKKEGRGGVSEVAISVSKDREGMVRPHTAPTSNQIAILRLDSSGGSLEAGLIPPDDGGKGSGVDDVMQVAKAVRENPQSSEDLRKNLRWGKARVSAATAEAESTGLIQRGPLKAGGRDIWCPAVDGSA